MILNLFLRYLVFELSDGLKLFLGASVKFLVLSQIVNFEEKSSLIKAIGDHNDANCVF